MSDGKKNPTNINEYLAEVEARAAAATRGPWECVKNHISNDFYVKSTDGHCLLIALSRTGREVESSEFIAHARADIPKLIEMVRLLELQRVADAYFIGNFKSQLTLAEQAMSNMECGCPGPNGICSKCSYFVEKLGTDVG